MGNSTQQETVRQWTDDPIRTRKRTHQIREILVRDADPEVIRQEMEALQGPPKPRPQEPKWIGWWLGEEKDRQSQQATKQVALIGWGLRHDLGESADPAVGKVIEMLEKKGYGIQMANGNLQAWSPTDREVRGDLAKQLKGRGVQTAIFFVGRSNQALQLAWGDLSIAGIKLWLVPIEGFNSTPMPCTMRYKKLDETPPAEQRRTPEARKAWAEMYRKCGGLKEIGSHPLEAGSWVKHQVAGVTAYRWKEPRWTFDELAATTFPFGSVIMWKPDDYEETETHVASRWVRPNWRQHPSMAARHGSPIYRPLTPPEGISYPHELNLEGMKFCEVPLRYIDYLAGQPWIYGEFAQRLRQYHSHPVIQQELQKFTPWTETLGGKGTPDDKRNLESNSTGYWNKDNQYVSTMCEGRPMKVVPTWLVPRDRFGKPLKAKARYNECQLDRAARMMEWLGYEDLEDQPAYRWVYAMSWAFDEYAPDSWDGRLNQNELEHEHVNILDEEPDFQRDPRKQRFPYLEEEWDMGVDISLEAYQLSQKAERNAWYTALDLSEQLAHLQQRARAAQTSEDWNSGEVIEEFKEEERMDKIIQEANETPWTDLPRLNREYFQMLAQYSWKREGVRSHKQSLLEEFRSITLQVTPLLIRMLGMGVRDWLYQQAKEVLADVKRAAHRTHEDPYVQEIIDVLEEEPKVANKLVDLSSVMPDVVEDILAQCPELVSDEIKDAVKAAKKRRASLFPELYTQKGTRRVRCAHDKVTA